MFETTSQITPIDAIPYYWHTIDAVTREGLAFYGVETLEALAKTWQHEARDCAYRAAHPYTEEYRQKELTREAAACAKMRYLERLAEEAEEKPVLSEMRRVEHFNIGDQVFCLQQDNSGSWSFVPTHVIEGYMHHEGRVTVRFDELPPHGLPFYSCGYNWAGALLPWELDYLRQHPDFRMLWLDFAENNLLKNFPGDGFRQAIS